MVYAMRNLKKTRSIVLTTVYEVDQLQLLSSNLQKDSSIDQ